MIRPEDLEADIRPPRRSLALPLVIVVLALAGAGYLGWRAWRSTDPTRVLVAIDLKGHWFEGSMPAARLADEVNEALASLGLQPVRPGDPEVLAALDGAGGDARAAARKLGAGYVITGRIKPEFIEHPIGEGYRELRAEGEIEVLHVDDATGEKARVWGWSGAPTEERALKVLAEGSLALQVVSEALPRLLHHRELAALLGGDARAVAALQPAQRFIVAQARELETAAKAYAAYEKRRLADEKGPVPVSYHGPTSADDALCGAGPAGVCVKTETARLFVSPRTLKLSSLDELETVEWRGASEAAPKVVFSGYNIYGYPQVSPDGAAVAFVEDIFGWARAINLSVGGEKARRLRVDPALRFSTPRPAPGGAGVAVFASTCRRCPSGLLVLDAEGKTRFEAPPEGVGFDGFGWIDADHLLVVHTPTEAEVAQPPEEDADGDTDEAAEKAEEAAKEAAEEAAGPTHPARFAAERQTVWRVPLPGGAPQVVYTTAEGESLQWMEMAPDGKRAVFTRAHPDGGSGLAVLDIEAGTLALLPVEGRASAPTFSPDGATLAFNLVRPGE
ncbi:MAG: PD40 domain-containing protein, partial [Myxococcales bacterium]|nr:PD40 domain-containing protein [Myxococcales bacterium]